MIKLYIVDDDIEIQKVYKMLFERKGYEVSVAGSSEELYLLIEKEIPDIILLDANLPGKSGFDILKEIKNNEVYKDVQVIMISSIFRDPLNLAEGFKKGADGYIVRPVNDVELLSRMDAVVKHKKTIDELRRSEAKLRKIINFNPDPILITNRAGKIRFANHSAEEIFGKSIDKLIGADFGFPLTGKGKTEIEIMVQGNPFVIAEMRVVEIEFEEENSFLITLRDITEKQNMLKKLEEYSQTLIKLNSAKDKMFSLISHDLRSPYQQSLSIAEIFETDIGSLTREEISGMAKILKRVLTNQLKLVDDLLQWAKIQTGKYNINAEKINLYSLINEITELLKPNLDNKQITIVNNITECCNVVSDKLSLSSIIKNLIENAIKFSFRGAKIEISSECVSDKFLIKVRDYGVGMSEEHIKMLFTAGEKITTQGTENEKGNGIGLLLCREIATKLKGEIKVESKKGEGSTFIIELPCEE